MGVRCQTLGSTFKSWGAGCSPYFVSRNHNWQHSVWFPWHLTMRCSMIFLGQAQSLCKIQMAALHQPYELTKALHAFCFTLEFFLCEYLKHWSSFFKHSVWVVCLYMFKYFEDSELQQISSNRSCMAEAQGIPPGFQEPSAPDTPRLGVA